MEEETRAQFNAGARAWADYNRRPLGRIRRAVTWHNLVPHLPALSDPEQPPRILDAGGGSGELALRLVRQGYQVWLLDFAPAMLDEAREAAKELPTALRPRLDFCLATVEEAPRIFAPQSFDAITCHTLIEYVSQPRSVLTILAGLLRPGGLLSVSFVNRHAELLRRVWSKADPSGALDMLEDGAFCASLFDLSGNAYTAEEVSTYLEGLGLTVAATYGVRALSDYVSSESLADPEFFDALLRLEKAVTSLSPYSLLARYVHLIARKPVEPF